MKRFVFSPGQRQGEKVTLNYNESQHITRVLRLVEGALIELVDGSENLFLARIADCAKGERVTAHIIESRRMVNNDSGRLWLAQCVVKTKHMEFLLQKCTELGVASFTPCVSSRTQGNLVEQAVRKEERWRRIISEACKQCKRQDTMTLENIHSLEQIVQRGEREHDICRLVLFEGEKKQSFSDVALPIQSSSTVEMLIGPEGGFHKEEVEILEQAGYLLVGLGKRILRAETAAIAAVAVIQHIRGNI